MHWKAAAARCYSVLGPFRRLTDASHSVLSCHAVQARAQVEAAKQQLVLLEAEADGARIRGQAEAQAAEVRDEWRVLDNAAAALHAPKPHGFLYQHTHSCVPACAGVAAPHRPCVNNLF